MRDLERRRPPLELLQAAIESLIACAGLLCHFQERLKKFPAALRQHRRHERFMTQLEAMEAQARRVPHVERQASLYGTPRDKL